MNHFVISVQKDDLVFEAKYHLYREPQCVIYYSKNGWVHKLPFRSSNNFYSSYLNFNFKGKPTTKDKWDIYLGPVALSNPILQKIDKHLFVNTSNNSVFFDNRLNEEKMLDQNREAEMNEYIAKEETFNNKMDEMTKEKIAQLLEKHKSIYERISDKDTFNKMLYEEIYDNFSYDNTEYATTTCDDLDETDLDDNYIDDYFDEDTHYKELFENFVRHETYLLEIHNILNSKKLKNVNPKLQKYKDEDIVRITKNIINSKILTSEDGFDDGHYDKSIFIRQYADLVYCSIREEEEKKEKEKFLNSIESRVKRVLGDVLYQIDDVGLFLEVIKTECDKGNIFSKKPFNELVRNKCGYVLKYQEIYKIIESNYTNKRAHIHLDDNNLHDSSNYTSTIYEYIAPLYKDYIYVKGSSKIKPSISKLKSSGIYVENLFDVFVSHKLLSEIDSEIVLNEHADLETINREIFKLAQ